MNRSRLVGLGLSGLIAMATFIVSTGTVANATPKATEKVTSVNTSNATAKVNVGGFWLTVTKWPSKNGSLSGIARSVYGKTSLWTTIYGANKTKIRNPNLIQTGQRIYVPVLNSKIKITTPNKITSAVRTRSTGWVKPLNSLPTTSCYGMRWGSMHQGIDYDGVTGQRIYSVGSGTVKKAGWWAGDYGISVLIYHGNNTYTHYAHMSRLAVGVGRTVKAGTVIGYVGATGHVTGSHLHFEVWRGMWGQINPGPWLRAHGVKTGC